MHVAEKSVSTFQALKEKIESKTARVGIVGLGYVGLPLAVEFAKAGFHVTGIDLQQSRVDRLMKGESYVQDVPSSEVAELVKAGRFDATSDFSVVSQLDTINICVPTPLRKTKDPDMSYIVSASESIAKYFHPGLLVILESTTYPGTTDELLLPTFEKHGLKVGEDFFLCFSPERVDPGNPVYQTLNTPKVVGGITPACTEMGQLFFSQALQHVVPVSNTRVAEMVKLLENTFRMINIGLVNEMAVMCDGMGITSGKSSTPPPPSRSASCRFTLAPDSAATASPSTRSTFRGRPSNRALKPDSSSLPDTSTATCRTSLRPRSRERSTITVKR